MLSIYNASAGSGKTFTLTQEYLRMLFRDTQTADDRRLSHSRILAVTFTKKSTAEMKERILRELYLLSTSPDESQHTKELLQDSTLKLDIESLQKQARKLLIGILQDYTRFSVSTIDGFFQQVIRTFAMELGLSATYDLSLDGEEMVQQAVDAIFKRIRENHSTDKELLKWIIDFTQKNIEDDQHWNPSASIKQFSTQLLKEQVIRCMDEMQKAFSDKKTMQNYRQQLQSICETTEGTIQSLIHQATAIFSTEEGWQRNILSAFRKTPEDWLKGKMGNTFHKVLETPTAIFTKSTTTKAKQEILLDIYHQQLEPIFLQLHELCTGLAAKDYLTARAILPNLYTMGILLDVAGQIEDTNRNIGRLPISETNKLVHQIIDGQDAPFIYERYGQYFRHYMIDEFQDTSALQWENFAPLIAEAEGQNQNNLIVGDVKQSIYRFRNSDWHLLKNVHTQFENAKVHPMENNWRTAPTIITENEKLLLRYSKWVAEQIDATTQQETLSQEIREVYNNMHQEAAKTYDGYFHLQFFEGKTAEEQTLETLHLQLQSISNEGIDLKRVTLLVRYAHEAVLLAKFLTNKGYNVQSAEGLQLGSNPIIQLLISLLKQEGNTVESIDKAYIQQTFGQLTEQQHLDILQAQELPLYEQVQTLINLLQLAKKDGAEPYLTKFQDLIFHFTKNRVADRKAFLEYWERKGYRTTIAAANATNTIRIMTIHSSKGLEFDIVFIPFFTWDTAKMHPNDTIWCRPTTHPFDTLPLVAVKPSESLLLSHFRQDYIQELIAQYIDNLNLVYVAVTRPKYRLYIYGQLSKHNSNNIASKIFALYKEEVNNEHIYRVPATGNPAPLPPLDEELSNSIPARYTSVPIGSRLTLRSRSEDDFASDAPLATVDLGILMHLWLSKINTWEDAEPALQRLLTEGQVTEQQSHELRQQFSHLKSLILRENHSDWFSNQYTILSEQNILIPSGRTQRPDRVMIADKHAIVIDYKFGHEQPTSHLEQVRDYMSLLRQMGYTTEGHIVYVALQTIYSILD